jgi:hypothetical protein
MAGTSPRALIPSRFEKSRHCQLMPSALGVRVGAQGSLVIAPMPGFKLGDFIRALSVSATYALKYSG